jgi:hypothetical protein
MLSLVLGTTALIFFFMPILGIPTSALGLLFGVVGVCASLATRGVRLRWSMLGCAMCTLALSINLLVNYAPGRHLPPPRIPRMWQSVPDRPAIPPPAKPAS